MTSEITFYVVENHKVKVNITSYPAFSLIIDNWNDYGTECKFFLYFYDKDGERHEIGNTKILHEKDYRTSLPDKFDSLNDEYISLGQDVGFYQALLEACQIDLAKNVLESLRDIAWQPPLAEPFETKSPFRNSLLRFNTAQKARRVGQAIILGHGIDESYKFVYRATIPGAAAETECFIDLDKNDDVPGRVAAIIGRNATGKTQYLSKMATDLVQILKISQKRSEQRDESFEPQRPLFNRLIAVSYSAFDQFIRPQSKQASYVYCGIRDEKGGLSRRHLTSIYKSNLARIRKLSRESDWLYFMQEILGERGDEFEKHLEEEIAGNNIQDKSLSLLSSGQAILANFITSLVAWLDEDSIVLFDEPETHLHPNAVASLFNAFNKMLNKYDAYAVVATHSPLVIQEVPRKRVIVFEREGNYTTASRIPIETFGENVAELTRHVFETVEIPTYYKGVLKELSQSNGFDEIMNMFDGKLSMNAQSFLLSQYMGNDDEGPE